MGNLHTPSHTHAELQCRLEDKLEKILSAFHLQRTQIRNVKSFQIDAKIYEKDNKPHIFRLYNEKKRETLLMPQEY